ncbi:MAG TPA: hypothetical protein ACFYEA_06155 [Candidatus Tripitaka californicus]|uniref:hypothetical protein n=1 Tax=Candidatus Tripitaka californicus TaxID=3367616 RepID=UPI0040254583
METCGVYELTSTGDVVDFYLKISTGPELFWFRAGTTKNLWARACAQRGRLKKIKADRTSAKADSPGPLSCGAILSMNSRPSRHGGSTVWKPKQRRFLQLLSSGSSPEEIARELKVNPKLLSRWRSLPGFQEALEETCKDRIMEEMPRLLQALTEKAKEGNVQAIKILFDYLGQLRGKNETNFGDFNEEERQKVKALLKEIIDLDEPAEDTTPPEGCTQGDGVGG